MDRSALQRASSLKWAAYNEACDLDAKGEHHLAKTKFAEFTDGISAIKGLSADQCIMLAYAYYRCETPDTFRHAYSLIMPLLCQFPLEGDPWIWTIPFTAAVYFQWKEQAIEIARMAMNDKRFTKRIFRGFIHNCNRYNQSALSAEISLKAYAMGYCFIEVFYVVGTWFLALGDKQTAHKAFRNALEIEADMEEYELAYYYEICMELGEHDKVKHAVESLVKARHGLLPCLMAARDYVLRKEPQLAIANVDRFIEGTDPPPLLCFEMKARILFQLNRFEEATSLLRKVLDSNPEELLSLLMLSAVSPVEARRRFLQLSKSLLKSECFDDRFAYSLLFLELNDDSTILENRIMPEILGSEKWLSEWMENSAIFEKEVLTKALASAHYIIFALYVLSRKQKDFKVLLDSYRTFLRNTFELGNAEDTSKWDTATVAYRKEKLAFLVSDCMRLEGIDSLLSIQQFCDSKTMAIESTPDIIQLSRECAAGQREDEKLNIDRIARHACVSRSTLFRHHKERGLSPPMTGIREGKLTRAARLLITTEEPVKRIAEEVELELSFFYKKFKNRFCLTPMEYRLKKRPPKNLLRKR